jgi:hypothetical protein
MIWLVDVPLRRDVSEGNWIIKELIKKHFQHRRDYNKRKRKNNEKENGKILFINKIFLFY